MVQFYTYMLLLDAIFISSTHIQLIMYHHLFVRFFCSLRRFVILQTPAWLSKLQMCCEIWDQRDQMFHQQVLSQKGKIQKV